MQTTRTDAYTYNGSTSATDQTTTYSYDSYGRLTDATATANDGGATGSPTSRNTHTEYVWNDSVSATSTGATGTYLLDLPAQRYVADTGGATRTACVRAQYDGNGYVTGQQGALTQGTLTSQNTATDCGNAGNGWTPSGVMRATTAYDPSGNPIGITDPLGVKGVAAHLGCTLGSTSYTTCLTYDSAYDTQVVAATNTLGQVARVAAAPDASGGFGLWPTSTTDANGQTATTAYDGLGRTLRTTLPGETTGLTTTTTSYTDWCSATGAQTPCVEVDTTQRLDSANTVTARRFYDGFGRLVETRSAAPGGQDSIQYAFYDAAGRQVVASVPYFVAAYTGGPGAAAFATPDTTQAHSHLTYTSLLAMTSTDPLGNSSVSAAAVVCAPSGTGGDPACYAQATSRDAKGHQTATLTDAWGRVTYTQRDTGNSPASYAVYATTRSTYDLNGDLTVITQPDGTSQTTFSYDAAGRTTGMSDPDRGSESYSYDANGNVTQTTDARGASGGGGVIYAGYDGLNRQLWRNTSTSPTGAYVTYSYDQSGHGSSVGRLTGETFSDPSGVLGSGSYSYTYDARGQTTTSTLTVGGSSYPVGTSYNDAGQALALTYPTGETVTAGYSATGWLGSLTRTLGGTGGTATTLLDAITYTGSGGASGQMTSAHLGNDTYSYSASFDVLARPTDVKTQRISDGATLFEEAPSYDAVGDITSETLTLPTGTDTQQFCYDDLNRLTWAGSVGTPPCTGTAMTPGSLTSAQYTQSFAYDALNRLTSGPLGSYSYGDAAHLDAATQVGSGGGQYTASYDASGNMVCRASDGSTTCAGGSPTGQQLTWDNEGRLTSWQNAPSSPTSTAQYLYDGEGDRVQQQATTGGTTTTTTYVGALESVATTGATTTTTTYYYAAGQRIALAVNGTLSYLASDLLGSATVALDGSGTPTASQLYAPYGTTRYANGVMPTDYGFTGQRADSASGLDYYGARYYDPTLGQFVSADTVLDGLNRYGYVGGNPTNATDPSGHSLITEIPGAGEGQYVEVRQGAEGSYSDGDGGGGGGGINLWPLFKGIGSLLGTLGTDIYEAVTIPTAYAPGSQVSGPDELTRALARTAGVDLLRDLPYYNQGHRPQGAPATPSGGGGGGGNGPSTGGGAPQTQTGGGNAGGTFGGGVTTPASPEDDGCGCGYLTFYRGTTIYAANEVVENQGLDIARIAANQRDFGGVVEPGNIYITSQSLTANYYADLVGGDGTGGGPGILRIDVPADAFGSFATRYGISVESLIPRGPFSGATETRIPFEYVSEFDQFARYSLLEEGGEC